MFVVRLSNSQILSGHDTASTSRAWYHGLCGRFGLVGLSGSVAHFNAASLVPLVHSHTVSDNGIFPNALLIGGLHTCAHGTTGLARLNKRTHTPAAFHGVMLVGLT